MEAGIMYYRRSKNSVTRSHLPAEPRRHDCPGRRRFDACRGVITPCGHYPHPSAIDPLIPTVEPTAESGNPGDGYPALLAGLRRAREAQGQPWAEELVQRWQ